MTKKNPKAGAGVVRQGDTSKAKKPDKGTEERKTTRSLDREQLLFDKAKRSGESWQPRKRRS